MDIRFVQVRGDVRNSKRAKFDKIPKETKAQSQNTRLDPIEIGRCTFTSDTNDSAVVDANVKDNASATKAAAQALMEHENLSNTEM